MSRGVSTHKVGEIAQTLMGVAPSGSSVSRLNQTLTEQYEAWRERPLLDHYRIIYLDGIHFTVRHGTQTDATMILTALGVDLEGSREVLAFRACAEEDNDGWLAAVSALFPATLRQRCLVHKQPSAAQCHSQTGAARGHRRTDGHLQAGKERRCLAQSNRLQSQIPPALSRSGAEPERR